ncbi:3152_t:CDS:2, partial [Racocetra fulgida]
AIKKESFYASLHPTLKRVQEKEYALEENFQSICKIENGIVEKEPSSEEIKFLEKRSNTERLHKNNSINYADAPYLPQLMGITKVLKEELQKKDQIKSALVVSATYVKYKYKSGDPSNIENHSA